MIRRVIFLTFFSPYKGGYVHNILGFFRALPSDVFSVLILTSQLSPSEGLPRSVLEAAAAGLPMIATNVGGTKELFPRGTEDFLIQQKNPGQLQRGLEVLLGGEQKWIFMGHLFQDHVKQFFSWDTIIQKYYSIFDHVMKGKERV